MPFEPGTVLRAAGDDRPIRVLMADGLETFHDALFPEVGWNLAPRRTANYYRVPTPWLRSNAEPIGAEPLTEAERERHRPDLPLRLLRSREASWTRPVESWPAIDGGEGLAAPRLAIVPFGPKGAPLRPVTIEAANGRCFPAGELLRAAQRLQAATCPEVDGVGLYRLGIAGGVPSYYLWGAVDRAGHAA